MEVPPDWEFKQLFLDEFAAVAMSSAPKPFAFDSIRSHAILTLQHKLWPIVYMNSVRILLCTTTVSSNVAFCLTSPLPQIGLFLVAVPLIEGVMLHESLPSSDIKPIEYYKELPLVDMCVVCTNRQDRLFLANTLTSAITSHVGPS